MNSETRETAKLGLLGVIALTLIVNTYVVATKKSGGSYVPQPATSAAVATPAGGVPTDNPMGNPNPNLSTTINPADPTTSPIPVNPNQKNTRISFATYAHDFGTVKQNSTNKFAFKFTNTGDEPLLITSAVGSCGCTVPNYPKDPIAPGKSATIDVEYKPGLQKDAQEKKVTVTANTEPSQTILTIKANVIEE
ncbi:MAG TPA: DUF1573 domain-containing protein [Flavobacteriales bacterium]|nr:DUF1573 domain-containing protein [Flavobacteriales bacterium]HRJ36447.1 DUF1573 domain-containing protein [Flavobacteriales bacterium]HRJ38596.1 DUF1573 domain-containing protein [Flavobacteriales bacterium]